MNDLSIESCDLLALLKKRNLICECINTFTKNNIRFVMTYRLIKITDILIDHSLTVNRNFYFDRKDSYH